MTLGLSNNKDYAQGFPDSSLGKESACNTGDPWFDSWVGKICWRRDRLPTPVFWASPVAQLVKNPPAMQETPGLIPGLGRCPGGEIGYPLQYSCLENPMDYIVHEVAKSQT